MAAKESRHGVDLSNLDDVLFDGAGATKRDLVDYLDAMQRHLVRALRDRPLSVIRALRGQAPFMQKNVPKYTPDWVRTVSVWSDTSKRHVAYALCNDLRTLLWFGNQRAIEYHVPLFLLPDWDHPTHLILDIDPPAGGPFGQAVQAARLARHAFSDAGLQAVVKTSGSKGLHVVAPVNGASIEEAAAATRALAARAEALDPAVATTAFLRADRGGRVFLDSTRAGGATVAAVYSPRLRPGVTVSYPLSWDDLDSVTPQDFTIHTVPDLLDGADPWTDLMPAGQVLPSILVEEGRHIPAARAQALHEHIRAPHRRTE